VPEHRITVLICAAIRLYREGLARVLVIDPRLEVVGTADTTRDALPLLRACRPDVLLVDLERREAVDTLPAVREAAPDTRVLGIAVPELVDEVLARAEAGIDGFLTREASLEELVTSIVATHRGEAACSPAVVGALLRRVGALAAVQTMGSVASLTERQREVVELIRDGLSNKQIAVRLAIELPTVKNHVHAILEKLELASRDDVARLLIRN
jgi:two-component system, NarL family, nitrate/nitrite response regulator NarL